MKETIACHECDLLIELPERLAEDNAVYCPRCNNKITSGHKNAIDYIIAIGLAGLVVLTIANIFPFMAFETQGNYRSIALIQASFELYREGFYVLSALIFLFIIVLPAVYLMSLLWLVIPIKMGWKRKRPIRLGIFIGWLLPWSMAEVFLVGVLVSLVKLVSMADIFMGIAFWSYLVFTFLFTYLASIVDSHKLWHWVEWGYNHRYQNG